MAPFTAWLPAMIPSAIDLDLVITITGEEVSDISAGMLVLERALADQGYAVFSQIPARVGGADNISARLRVTLNPVSSVGNGHDVIVSLDRRVPETVRVGLQEGSALVCDENAAEHLKQQGISNGVIVYPVPFVDLNRGHGNRSGERGLIAAGVLTHLLGLNETPVQRRISPDARGRCFDAGLRYARTRLVKRDIHSLPASRSSCPQVLLNTRQAAALGLVMGACPCDAGCLERLQQVPSEWIARHLELARRIVISSPVPGRPGSAEMRCADGMTSVVLGCADPIGLIGKKAGADHMIAVPGDMISAMKLACRGRELAQARSVKSVLAVDETLMARHESVALTSLARLASFNRRRSETPVHRAAQVEPPFAIECDAERDATVGYIAWGSVQGVVREAIALCRRFGIRVAALYPTLLKPVPTDELERFASDVKQAIVVEPNRERRYTRFVQGHTKVRPGTIEPEPGQLLTPMDIFMKEHLGADLVET